MLRLSPAATMLWRSADDLQFGVDPPLAVLHDVRVPTLRMLTQLAAGCDRERLDRVARGWCVPANEVDRLLALLEPALERESPEERIPLPFDGPDALAALLGGDPADGRSELVVLGAHHVLVPARYLPWLADDVPHLPVVFGDAAVTVGPLVRPGVTACLRCVDEHRIDADAAWPAIAAQLLGRGGARTAADTVVAVRARHAVRLAVLDGRLDVVLRIDADGVSERPAPPRHPRCSCADLASARPADPRRTG